MSLILQFPTLTFAVVMTILKYCVPLLRSRLHGRQPCRQWFAFLLGTVGAALVFSIWCGVYGLGAVEPGFGGAVFGLYCGLFWGGLFSLINSQIFWSAFDSPNREYSNEHEQTMNPDMCPALSGGRRLRSFRPNPAFVSSGALPWAIFLAAIILSMIWSYGFCQMVWMTEGAPGVEPVMPIDR